jgi:hypothetical protein
VRALAAELAELRQEMRSDQATRAAAVPPTS